MTGVVAPDSTDTVTPDPNGDGDSTVSGADHTSTAYDWLGRVESTTDQNNTFSSIPTISGLSKASYRASYRVILCP